MKTIIIIIIRSLVIGAAMAYALFSLTSCTKTNEKASTVVNTDTIVPNEFLVQLCTVNKMAPNLLVDSLSIDGVMYNDGDQAIFCINISPIASATIIVYGHQLYSQQAAAACYYFATALGSGEEQYPVAPPVLQSSGYETYTLTDVPVNNSAKLQFANEAGAVGPF